MKPIRYELVYDGDWEPVKMRGERNQCCQCCMTHVVDYRFVKKGKRNELQSRVRYDRGATTKARKRAGIKIVRTKPLTRSPVAGRD